MKKLLLLVILACSFALQAQAAHSVDLTWTASSSAAANPTGLYNVYRADGNCATAINFVKIGSTSSTLLAFTDSTVIQVPTVATSYCFEVTFAAAGSESLPSNAAQAVISVTVTLWPPANLIAKPH